MIKQILFVLLFFFQHDCGFGQKLNASRIVGTWKLAKYDFLESQPDSNIIKDEGKKMYVIFKKDMTYSTLKENHRKMVVISSGKFAFSDDGKKLIQDEKEASIHFVNEKLFRLTHDSSMVLTFKRCPTKSK